MLLPPSREISRTNKVSDETLRIAVEKARQAAQEAGEYKSETYLAVLLTGLLVGGSATEKLFQTRPIAGELAATREKPYSPGELFAAKAWNTEIDKVALAAYYMEHYAAATSYTIQEIRNCLISAKTALPKNLSLAILKAVQKGWLMDVPTNGERTKAWALTQTGERYVDSMTNRRPDL